MHVYRELLQGRQEQLLQSFDNGSIKPFFLWQMLVLIGLPLLGLMAYGSRWIRRAVLALIPSVAFDILQHRRFLLGAGGYISGVIISYWIIWSMSLLLFNDPVKNFKRIERRPASIEPINPMIDMDKNGEIRPSAGRGHDAVSSCKSSKSSVQDCAESPRAQYTNEVVVWQAYPQGFLHRLNWTFDLLCNMRGAQWNWRGSGMGPFPASVQRQLDPGQQDTFCEVDESKILDTSTRLRSSFWTLLKSYLTLDLLKVLMVRDPYFLGLVSPVPPPPFPFSYLPDIPILITIYRQFLTGFGVYVCLLYATLFNAIIFLGLSVAFPNFARTVTSVPLDAPWLYTDIFGPFCVSVADGGLAACWGQWWHQLFRAGFTNAGRWVLSFFPENLAAKRAIRQTVIVFVAFVLSGFLHANGSYGQIAETNPRGPLIFFFLQAVGISIESTFKTLIRPALLPSTLPRALERTANCLFAACWLVFSGTFIADDFARGGIWLAEPVPVSLLRGLNIGVKGEGWWCWKEPWFRYFEGKGWWDSGVAVL